MHDFAFALCCHIYDTKCTYRYSSAKSVTAAFTSLLEQVIVQHMLQYAAAGFYSTTGVQIQYLTRAYSTITVCIIFHKYNISRLISAEGGNVLQCSEIFSFTLKMHEKTLGHLAPPRPAGGAYSAPQTYYLVDYSRPME